MKMPKRDNYKKFFTTKARPTKGLRKGSFTPLQVERSKSLSISVSSNKDLKSTLPAIKKSIIIPETQASDDTLQYSQEKPGCDNNVGEKNTNKSLIQEELEILVDSDPDMDGEVLSDVIPSTYDLKCDLPVIKKSIIIPETQTSGDSDSDKIINDEFLPDVIASTYDLKCDLPGIKKSIIIPETQASNDGLQLSQEEQKYRVLEDKNPSKSFIDSQEEFEIEVDSDSDSDEIIDDEFLPDVIASTYDTLEKKSGVGGNAKFSKKNKDSRIAKVEINKPPITHDSDKIIDDEFLPDVIDSTYDTLEKKSGVGGNAKFSKKNKDSRMAKVKINKPPITHADARALCTNDVVMGNAIEAKAKKLNYKPAKNDEQKLAALCVKMRHAVLPQHKVESAAGTRTMNDSERASFEKHAELRKGSFGGIEDKKIKENWSTFCQDNNWDQEKPQPFLLMSHNNNKKFLLHNLENRKNFVRCLAHGLPNRCLYSVYQRFKNIYGDSSKKKLNYTHAEDRQILQYVAAYSHVKAPHERDHQFANLATVMKRPRSSIYRRFRLLKK